MVPGCIAAKPKVWQLAAPLAIASAVAPAQAAIRDRVVDMGVPFSVPLSAPLAWRPGGACSIHRLRRDIVSLEILHSARMVCDLVLLVGERRRELAQYRLHRDKLVLVVEQRVEDLEDELVARLDAGEEQVVEAVDLHWFVNADKDRSRADISQVAPALDLASGGHPLLVNFGHAYA